MTGSPSEPHALEQVSELGVSVWLDDLNRSLVTGGELRRLIDDECVVGVTSNPAIFASALADGDSYAEHLGELVRAGKSTEDVMWALMVGDVQAACDAFADVYISTRGVDGRVSLEVDPGLAFDAEKTITMAKHLWSVVGRQNLMIKIPATEACLPAISAVLGAGISVNVTLIFGAKQYRKVLDAFVEGLTLARAAGHDLGAIHSVASFFVSRVDTEVDARLASVGSDTAERLIGRAGLANARVAFDVFTEHAQSDAWAELAAAGANQQRPLWASTGVKNPDYPDDMYVTGLATAGVVNTMPRATMDAVADHGVFAGDTVIQNVPDARAVAKALFEEGVDLDEVAALLEREGVKKFQDAWASLTSTVTAQIAAVAPAHSDRAQGAGVAGGASAIPSTDQSTNSPHQGGAPMTTTPAAAPLPGSLTVRVGTAVASASRALLGELAEASFPTRLAKQDATLWGEGAEEESRIRLGWTDLAERSAELLPRIHELRDELVGEGITRIVLCGMGGSSLAPEVIAASAGVRLVILDGTDPHHVQRVVSTGLDRTAVVVASKSGSTVETDSARRAFIEAFTAAGVNAASRMIVVTDPGSPLDAEAQASGYRAVFHADPHVGGRYSALSAFGLVPSGLAGANISELLTQAKATLPELSRDVVSNPALVLGTAMGDPATGKSKIVLVPGAGCPQGLGHWIEQLVAESTGKEQTGVLPVVVADASAPELSKVAEDVTVVHLVGSGERQVAPADSEVVVGGSLGAMFQLWETATAVSGRVFGINPFDQPDVESAKKAARAMLSNPPAQVAASAMDAGVDVFVGEHVPAQATTARAAVDALLATIPAEQGYLGVMVYADREEMSDLESLRPALAARAGRPVTFGWGPRFLHSTGQYHKGGPAVGCYLVVTVEPVADLAIPDRGFSFGQLIAAQAHGDVSVLEKSGRPVVRLHVTDAESGWSTVRRACEGA